MDEEDIDLSPEENDRFWAWMRTYQGGHSPVQDLNVFLASLPDDPKPNRNDPCPECAAMGIAIKFKKCSQHYY